MDGIGYTDTIEDSREALLRTIETLRIRTHELETECAELRSTRVADVDIPRTHDGDSGKGRAARRGEAGSPGLETLSEPALDSDIAVEWTRAESALRAERARLRAMIDTAPIGFLFIDTQRRITLLNDEAKRIWAGSKPLEELRELDYRAFWPEIGRPLEIEEWPGEQALFFGRSTRDLELEIERFDGSRGVVLLSGASIRDTDGTILGAVVATQDITARRRAEVALRESEENFRSIANVVPDLLWSSEPDGSTTWYNERWMEYTGQTIEEAVGWGWVNAIHPDDRELSVRRYRDAVQAGLPLQQEHRIRRHDGQYRWFLVRAQPSVDASGRVIRTYGAATDIHETRTTRDELEARVAARTGDLADAVEAVRRNEQRMRLLLEQMPAMLWTTDRELRVTALVGRAIPAFDGGAASASGQDIAELFADTVVNGGVTPLHRKVLMGTPAEFEFQVDSHTYEGYLEPLRDAGEEIIGTIGVAHEVTDRTLRKLQEDFIASVSHDLQTPLTSIRAGLGLLEAGGAQKLDPAERELLAASRRNTERLRAQIAQLLAANQIMAGSAPRADRAAIDLHEVVPDAVEAIRPVAQEKEQKVQVDLSSPLIVEGDRRLLDQVLTNLLTNAHRHTPPGTQITVSAWFVGADVRLAVHDTGPGIPADQLQAVFERFHRGVAGGQEGAGLGLVIARSAVEAQGGRVWAESLPGQGTTFFVSLPRARDTGSA